MRLTDWLETRLAHAPSPWVLGEIRIAPGYFLTHREDLPEDPRLCTVSGVEDLLELVRFDSAGRFRALRGAPGLRKGWRRGPLSAAELVADLQLFYPGAVGMLAAWEEGRLAPTSFGETAGRQTGIYEVTRRLSQEDLPALVKEICIEGCLRRPLWQTPGLGPEQREALPLLCPEACAYFLHKIRSYASRASRSA